MADKPWTESNISVNERARRVVSHNRDFNSTGVMVQTATEAIEAAVRDALAETGPKWISTKDAMPIVGNNVLALWSQSGTCERIYERCYVDEWGFWRYSRTGEQVWNNSVSHWQYVTVPEPPKEHQ